MGLWSYSGQERQGVHVFQCLLILFVLGGCFAGSFGSGLGCPSSVLTWNDTQLKIVSIKNQTRKEFCGASLETICFQDQASAACQILMSLSVNLMAEEDRVVEFGLTLLATQVIGKWEEIWCNVTDLAKDGHLSDRLFAVNWVLDYDCCDKGQSQEIYYSRLSVSYYKLEPCEATAIVRLKPESNEVSTPVNTVVPRATDNTLAENFDQSVKVNSLTGLVAAVVMAALGAIVSIIVVYIVCVKYEGGRCCKRRTDRYQTERTPLQTETETLVNCRLCNFENVEVVAPENNSIGCSTTEIDIIPPTISSSSSEEELTEDKQDSGYLSK